MSANIQISCGRMKVSHVGRGLMLTSAEQDPPATWKADGPNGEMLGGPIIFPATHVRMETPRMWNVDPCIAEGQCSLPYCKPGTNILQGAQQGYIKSLLPKERCDFVLWCPGCNNDFTGWRVDDGYACDKCHVNWKSLLPHVIARAILAPTTIQVSGFIGTVFQPDDAKLWPGQEGIVYFDTNSYFTGIGQLTVDATVATGIIKWSKQ